MKNLLTTTAIILFTATANAAAPERDAPVTGAWLDFYNKVPAIEAQALQSISYNDLYFLNKRINQSIKYKLDQDNTYKTPTETLQTGIGDCEDFAIVKWDELRQLGISEKNMEFVFGVNDTGYHTTLWVYQGDTVYYLDNNDDDITVNHLLTGSYTTYNRYGQRNYTKVFDLDNNGIVDKTEALKASKFQKKFEEFLEMRNK